MTILGQEKPPLFELLHQGVKGMKWGVRKDKGHVGQKAKTKKINRLDRKFERAVRQPYRQQSMQIDLHNKAARAMNDGVLDSINNKPAYKNADFTKNTPTRKRYNEEVQKAFIGQLEKAASDLGTNASGTKKYTIHEDNDGNWQVATKDVKHSSIQHANTPFMLVQVTRNNMGHVTEVEIPPSDDSMAQGEAFIQHSGILDTPLSSL